MAELLLPHDQTIALRASAHRLAPVVLMGSAGLSAAVLQEIDRALRAHGLVKVRGASSERAEREAMFLAIAEQLDAARVQLIGNTFVLFRPIPAAPPAAAAGARPKKAAARAGSPAPARRAPAGRAASGGVRGSGGLRGRAGNGGSRGR